jgi:hypothetical protein
VRNKTKGSPLITDKYPFIYQKLSIFLNLEPYNIVMAILTIYSIFAIDLEKSFFDQPVAYIFGYVHIIAISIFTV